MTAKKSAVQADVDRATETYAQHQLGRCLQGEGRWLLKRPNDGAFWAEIIHGEAGTILVHGDGPDIALRSWQWKANGIYLVRWIAQSNLGYLSEKVCMGKREFWDEDLARAGLADYIRECASNYEDEKIPEAFGDLLADMPDNETDLLRRLHDAEPDGWWEGGSFGVRPSWDLIGARAACRRLIELLDAEASAERSPAADDSEPGPAS